MRRRIEENKSRNGGEESRRIRVATEKNRGEQESQPRRRIKDNKSRNREEESWRIRDMAE